MTGAGVDVSATVYPALRGVAVAGDDRATAAAGVTVRATLAPEAPETGVRHIGALASALEDVAGQLGRIRRWASTMAGVLSSGGRLLAAGNGGSAAQAQHLTSELVGRYCAERRPFSAISLHAETSSITAVANDYGVEAMFARQVRAHGRTGDVLLALSTSGRSPNIVTAAEAATEVGMLTWALTGPAPNPLASVCDDALAVEVAATATVQEVHLVVVHLLCELFDEELAR